MLNGGSMIWGFCVYFVYMIPLETDVLRKHRFQKSKLFTILPAKSDSDVMFCLQSYQGMIIDRSLVH